MSKSVIAFMNHLGNGIDPHECWESGGFFPDKVNSNIEDLCVWACERFFSWCWSSQLFETVSMEPGRLLPEALEGLRVLGCTHTAGVINSVISELGDDFPRNDLARKRLCESIEESKWRSVYKLLYLAWEKDNYETKVDRYAHHYCKRIGLSS
jgi:hypothetical protein